MAVAQGTENKLNSIICVVARLRFISHSYCLSNAMHMHWTEYKIT